MINLELIEIGLKFKSEIYHNNLKMNGTNTVGMNS